MKQIPIEGVQFKYSIPYLYKCQNDLDTCIGLNITQWQDAVRFGPINSKGKWGSCWFDIAEGDVPAMTLKLPKSAGNLILDNLPRENLTLLLGIDPALDEEIERRLKEDASDENLPDMSV